MAMYILSIFSVPKSMASLKELNTWILKFCWKKFLEEPVESWGGLSGFELAAGFSYIDIDNNDLNQRNAYRFGPAVYFSKKSRLQVNAEIVEPAEKGEDVFWRIRSQFTVNF